MGNMTSIPVELCATFDADEIRRLGKRFKKLDIDGSGSLSVQEFMSIPELQQNPLVQRVIDIFDTDGNGEIDFKEFIGGISQFSVKGDKESKLKFAFKIYDMDKDGYISNGELFQVLKMMVGSNLKDSQLQQIVDKTIINADKDGDGKISFDEFCATNLRFVALKIVRSAFKPFDGQHTASSSGCEYDSLQTLSILKQCIITFEMPLTKRQNSCEDNEVDSLSKRFKLAENVVNQSLPLPLTSANIPHTVTRLEELTCKLFSCLFDYLDSYTLFKSFHNLNLQINQHLYQQIFKFLCCSQENQKLFFDNYSLVQLTSLQSLTLRNIKIADLKQTIFKLSNLKHLSHLSVDFNWMIGHINPDQIIKHIFTNLTSLRHLSLKFIQPFNVNAIPICTTLTHMNVHLWTIDNLFTLMSRLPTVRYLSVYIQMCHKPEIPSYTSDFLLSLIYLKLEAKHIHFKHVEQLLGKCPELKIFELITRNFDEFKHGNKWEELFLRSLRTKLNKFQICIEHVIDPDTIDLSTFQTKFWQEYFHTTILTCKNTHFIVDARQQ
ncbi:unnamed protein product [Didymodactylos carnosus]|uniref:EF-hand domain-containing protein n=1 Tax=Didymodactylos carnosus TaxID=1234261 RepID=A0A8S2GCS9_9BILA|nr:unnamed protein product [Didymodactylos carnosus]CAF3493637.1 unnamed protein product [Didymodactylos carnosus]